MNPELLKPSAVFPKRIPVSYSRGMNAIRLGIIPVGVVVRLGRQVFINSAKLEQFIDGGGAALPGGWRREASA
ncbi:MAG: hypothetical protein Q8O57_11845 [Kiritimatiellota bacterium]|nr:hypothetical protein [Kiritimatiellota bacterium]